MKTLLFVDDDERILKTASFYFKNKYNLLLAENSTKAFEYLQSNNVDLIISDYGMVGGNGVELKKRINESPYKNIPFVVVSGEINKESSIKFANLKVDSIIEKPLDLSLLETIIIDLIKQSQVQKEEVKFSFIGKNTGQIIHDINNSLGIIMLSSDVGEQSSEKPETSKRLFLKSKKACKNICDIITKYKTLSNESSICFKEYKIKEVESILNQEIEDFCSSYKINLDFQKSYSESLVSLDLILFKQAVLNLISNAKDSIMESSRIGNLRILFADNNQLLITISDNGEGIPDNIKQNLFQEKNSSKGLKGTGMGLSYCKQIIDLHFGKICLNKTDSNGTEFNITLPVLKSK